MCFVCTAQEAKVRSAGAEGAVNTPRQVGDSPLSYEAFQELGLFVHIMHALLQHGAHGQAVVVVQWRPLLGEVIAEACQAHLIAQQTG